MYYAFSQIPTHNISENYENNGSKMQQKCAFRINRYKTFNAIFQQLKLQEPNYTAQDRTKWK